MSTTQDNAAAQLKDLKEAGKWEEVITKLQQVMENLDKDSEQYVECQVQLVEACLKCDKLPDAIHIVQILLNEKQLRNEQEIELLCKLADEQEREDQEEIDNRVKKYMQLHPSEDEQQARRMIESEWANEGMEQGSDDNLETAFGTLKMIVERTAPDPRHVRYHECYLVRAVKAILVAELGSMERQQKRTNAFRIALDMCEGGNMNRTIVGGCTSPLPFVSALRLLEVSEEVLGKSRLSQHTGSDTLFENLGVSPGYRYSHSNPDESHLVDLKVGESHDSQYDVLSKVSERQGLRLAHAFPWNPNAYVQVGLAKARRERPIGICGSMSALKRAKMISELKNGMDQGAEGVSGWLQLANLYLDDEQPSLTLQAAQKGLEYIQKRFDQGHEPMVQACMFLRLMYAQALFQVPKLDEAEQVYNSILEMTSEGDMSLCSIAGLMPVSIRQQALRGVAQVALKKGDLKQAKFRYEKIMGRAVLAHSPTEHWAHAEYGWILFQEENFEDAKKQLEMAVEVAQSTHACVGELGAYHYQLGRAYWELGGDYKSNPEYARQQFILGAQMNGDFQAESFTWLGHYYREIKQDEGRAMQLYQKALALDPKQADNIPNVESLESISEGEKLAYWEMSNSKQLLKRANSVLQRIISLDPPIAGSA